MNDLANDWDNFYHIYKGWIEQHKAGITPELSAFIKQNMMRAYFTGAADKEKLNAGHKHDVSKAETKAKDGTVRRTSG
jgi:hypothetical protein